MNQFILLTLIASSVAIPTEDTSEKRVKDCANGILNPTCLKLGAIVLIERLNKKDEVSLLPGVTLVKDISEKKETAAEFARSFGKDDKLDKSLMYHIGDFLDNHSVKLRLVDDSAVKEATEILEEGRAKGGMGGGKKGGMGGLMAMAMMMKGTMMSLGMGGLALLAGKALMTALMSLLLSAIVGIKSISGGQKSTTYEIVSKPVYSHSHSHSTAHEDVGGYGHSGYGRNLNVRRRK